MVHRFRLAVVVVILSSTALAKSPLAKQADAIVQAAMLQHHIPAVSVAVAENGKVVFKHAYGFADLENNVPATPETLFRTGSIAKPMSAVGAMALYEEGKLNLDAPVQQYCPQYPRKQWLVTTREVLGHLSGIRHYKGDEIDSTRHYDTMAAGLSIFDNEPLLFPPGSKFEYSTYGYTLVGCVIEGASGEHYYDFMTQHVFRPAGMTHTVVDEQARIIPHRARGYTLLKNGQVINAGLMDSSYKIPGGGLISTPEDLVRFADGLMDSELLKPQTVKLMWTSMRTTDGRLTEYGLGFRVGEFHGEQLIAHTGGQQGCSTSLMIFPQRHLAIAVMINMDGVSASDIGDRIADMLVGAPKTASAGK